MLQKQTETVVTPSWLTRLPKTVGMPAAGNPKAADLLILVSVYFVLLLIPQWTWNPTQTHRIKTLNLSTKKIIQIINIVMAHSINVEDLRKLETTLVEYRKELLERWGKDIRPKPKIHYAQHMSDLVKDYGPPSIFSCWPGERFIGEITIISKNPNPSQLIFMSLQD